MLNIVVDVTVVAVFLRVLAPFDLPTVVCLVSDAVFHLVVGHERSASDQISDRGQSKERLSRRRRTRETKAERRRGSEKGQRRDGSWIDGDDDVGLNFLLDNCVFPVAVPLSGVHILRVLPDNGGDDGDAAARRLVYVRRREVEKRLGELRPQPDLPRPHLLSRLAGFAG